MILLNEEGGIMAEIKSRALAVIDELITPDSCEVCSRTATWHSEHKDIKANTHHWLCARHRKQWSRFVGDNWDFYKVIESALGPQLGWQQFWRVFITRAQNEYDRRRRNK